jgi:hypothetical protein
MQGHNKIMAEQKAEKKKPKNAKRTRKWVWCAAIVIVIAAITCCLLWKAGLLEFQAVDEQLAAIEAARAIPDEENAAIIYNQLMQDPNATSLLDYRPGFLDDDSDNLTARQPWSGKEYPELAVWIKEQQHVIDRLLEASKFDKCRFPIAIDPVQRSQLSQPYRAMRKWMFLLRRAANNDIGEGRIDDAIEKWRCLLQMGNHQCQQPVWVDLLVGIAVEAIALHQMASFIIESDLTEEHLRIIEAALPQTKNNWSKDSAAVLEVERLYERKQFSFISRLRLWRWDKDKEVLNRIQEIYLRLLADRRGNRRGNRILIALRRHKNKHDRWPQTLSEIQSLVPAEILIDPYNNGSFVYKLTDNNFELYSKGKNNIDEDGKYRRGLDDWPIWPGPGRSRQTKEENADAKQQ